MRPKIIPSSELRQSDLPAQNAASHALSPFALSYDPREMADYGQHAGDLTQASEKCSVSQLRAHLYVEQRRWNHFGREFDAVTLARLHQLLEWMRQQLPA